MKKEKPKKIKEIEDSIGRVSSKIILNDINNLISKKEYVDWCYFLLGKINILEKNLDSAKEYLTKSIELNENLLESYFQLGVAYNIEKDFLNARDFYKKALMIDNENIPTNLNMVGCLISLQEWDNAENIIDELLLKIPKNTVVHNYKGLISEQKSNFTQSIEHYNIAFKLSGNDISNYYISRVLEKQKKFEECEELLLNFLSKNPDFYAAYLILGNIQFYNGQLELAIDSYTKSLKMQQDQHIIYNNIGNCYADLENFSEAINFYDKAIMSNETYSIALNNKAITLNKLNKFDASLNVIRRAIEITPNNSDYYNTLGSAYVLKGDVEKGVDSYKKSISLSPDNVEAYNNLGGSLFQLGRNSDAIDSFKTALKYNPNNCEAFRSLVINKGINKDSDLVKYFLETYSKNEEILKDKEIIDHDSSIVKNHISLSFAFGYLFDQVKEYKKAFEYLDRGNSLHRKTFNYKIEDDQLFFNKIKEGFSKNLYNSIGKGGFNSKIPIFIIGMPRSGTTMVEQILSSHSNVCAAGEIPNLKEVAYSLNDIFKLNNQKDLIDYLDIDKRLFLGKSYVESIEKFRLKGDMVTNKDMHNYLYVGLIKLILPDSKIIHVKRNKFDTCFSIYSLFFSGQQSFAYNLNELGKYYSLYENIIAHWKDVLDNPFYEIIYEDLLSNQESETKLLLDYCNLSFEEECIEFYNNKRAIQTSSSLQVRQKPYKSSVERWKNYETELKPLKEILNIT
tara:strand:+ start:79 stop:2286 length:2208 start_codon:yes stop_codon:yes gene_type:complete